MARVRKFGRVPRKDKRDLKYAIKAKASSRTYRYWDGGYVLDQKDTPKCVAFSWVGWLLAPPIASQYVNPDGLYDICKFYDEWSGESYDGTSVRAGAKVLQMLGYITEYRWALTIDALTYTLLEEGPVVVGTNWYADMMKPNASGFIAPTGASVGGHAYRLTGINTNEGFLRVTNSWGTAWGSNGTARIKIADFQKLLKAQGEVCLAVEATPKYRR